MRDDAHRLALSLAHDLTRRGIGSVSRPDAGVGEFPFRRDPFGTFGASHADGLVLHHTCPNCGSVEHGVPYTLAAGRRVALSISRAPGAVAAAASIPAEVAPTPAATRPDCGSRSATIPVPAVSTSAASIPLPAASTPAATNPDCVTRSATIPATRATPTAAPDQHDDPAAPTELRLGIDIERADAAGFDGFAAVALHPAEPVPHDATEATRLWVRKEAVLKALGSGLRLDPRELRLAGCLDSTGANRSSEKPRVLAWPDPRPPSIVELCDLDAPAGYLAALAVIGGSGAAYTQAAIRLDTSSGV